VSKQFYEDFAVGDASETARYTVSMDEALAFAKAYDPQSFHLDADAARTSFFKRLVISGWQTAPVAPGDELRVHSEVVETISWPGGKPRGIVRFRNETINQDGVVVMTHIANAIVPKRT
jgi:acyl dehydratase